MPRMDPFEAMRLRMWRPSWWQLALIIAVVVAAVIAIAIVATSLVLIIAPIVLVAVLARQLLGRRATPSRPARPRERPRVIDAEYEIISADAAEDRGPPESGEERPRLE